MVTLVERRGEHLDVGLPRLAVAAAAPAPSREERVSRVLDLMTGGGPEDDIAILALGWSP